MEEDLEGDLGNIGTLTQKRKTAVVDSVRAESILVECREVSGSNIQSSAFAFWRDDW